MVIWISENLGFAPCDAELENGVCRLDVRDLVDRKGNDMNLLRSKIEKGMDILRDGRKLVVCCDLGISRSLAISIGILSMLGGSFDSSIESVANKIKDQSLNFDLLDDVRKSIGSAYTRKSKNPETPRILVLGSTGFIGSAFVERLSGQYSLFCPTSKEIDVAKDALHLYHEVNNRKIDVILDLAHPRLRNSLQSLATSVIMIRNILEASRVGDTSLVFLSSLQVFDGYCEGASQPLKSDLRPKPATIYGQSKALCEEYIRFYRDLYGLRVTTLRPPHVYGRGMDKHNFVWKFISSAAANKPITVHRYLNGFQKLDFLHVDDLIDVTERAIRLRPSEDINLGTGIGMSTLNMAELIKKLMKSKSEINIIDIKDHAADVVADISRAREVLKWKPKTVFQKALHALLPT